jgi:hypothetical protein
MSQNKKSGRIYVVYVIIIFAFVATAAFERFEAEAQNSSWRIIKHSPDLGGAAEAVLGFDSFMMILRQTSDQVKADIWLYELNAVDPTLLAQRQNPESPDIQFEPGASLAWDGKRYIYALVGATYSTRNRTGFLRYDTCFNQAGVCSSDWEFRAGTRSEQGPGNALSHARVNNQDFLFAFTGASRIERSTPANSFSRYDVESDLWENMPYPAQWNCTDDGVALIWDGDDSIYALGGSDCFDDPSGRFARFRLSASQWETLPALPVDVDEGGSLAWDGEFHVYALAGGASDDSSTGRASYRFNTAAKIWQVLDDIPCQVGLFHGNRLAGINGEIFYWEGMDFAGNCGGNAIVRFEGN